MIRSADDWLRIAAHEGIQSDQNIYTKSNTDNLYWVIPDTMPSKHCILVIHTDLRRGFKSGQRSCFACKARSLRQIATAQGAFAPQGFSGR